MISIGCVRSILLPMRYSFLNVLLQRSATGFSCYRCADRGILSNVRRNCAHCQTKFEITDADLMFYEKVSPVFNGTKQLIPPPTLCPDCRQQRRASFRNELQLHRRECDSCKKSIISLYDNAHPFRIFCHNCWWSGTWDACSFSVQYSSAEPALRQYSRLHRVLPRVSIFHKNCENSEYINHSKDSKNCYMCSVAFRSEGLLYCHWSNDSKDCIDCDHTTKSELCYQCINCLHCYSCTYSEYCAQCTNCSLCSDCHGCSDCMLSVNLRNKRYCIGNVHYDQQTYNQKKAELLAKPFSEQMALMKNMLLQQPHPSCRHVHCEDCTGDFMEKCKDTRHSFDVAQLQNCAYCYDGNLGQDCVDAHSFGTGSELLYDIHAVTAGYSNICANLCYNCSAVYYCDLCNDCSNCFLCVGLRRKSYCILNRQYTKDEYESLVPTIIERMRQDGEWGEFFPSSMSPFAYNETVAQEYYPLTKDEVLKRGWQWRDQKDEIPKVDRIIPAMRLPDSINAIPNDILHWAIECSETKRPFRIVRQELDFYRTLQLPIPRQHPEVRRRQRMQSRSARKLWNRRCAQCKKEMTTTYSPDRPEIVYCEECYLKAVY